MRETGGSVGNLGEEGTETGDELWGDVRGVCVLNVYLIFLGNLSGVYFMLGERNTMKGRYMIAHQKLH